MRSRDGFNLEPSKMTVALLPFGEMTSDSVKGGSIDQLADYIVNNGMEELNTILSLTRGRRARARQP